MLQNTVQTQEYVINTKEGRKTRQNHCNRIQTGLSTLRFENDHKERHGEAVSAFEWKANRNKRQETEDTYRAPVTAENQPEY